MNMQRAFCTPTAVPATGRPAAGPPGCSYVHVHAHFRSAAARRAVAASAASSSVPFGDLDGSTVLNNNLPGTLSWKQQLSGIQQVQSVGSWRPGKDYLTQDQLWQRIRTEAAREADSEPLLASALHTNILAHKSLGKAMAHLLALKMSSRTLLGTQLMRLINDAYSDEPSILDAAVADIQAVRERDPACESFVQCLLNYKGFQSVQCYRVGHWLWMQGRHTLAIALQSRVSEVLHVDIHPAARIGRGILVDHATGVVIGETAVVGDNVSMLHHVTLGGSGTGHGTRHPTIGNGALLGAGVSVLGPITLGAGCKVGAGSVVVQSLPDHCVAVGVPARVIKRQLQREPSVDMDQCKDFIYDYVI